MNVQKSAFELTFIVPKNKRQRTLINFIHGTKEKKMVKIKYPKSENELRESLCYNHSSYCFWGCHPFVKNESSFAFIETKLEGDFSFMLNVTIIILMYTFYYTHSWNERVNFFRVWGGFRVEGKTTPAPNIDEKHVRHINKCTTRNKRVE